MQDDNTVMTCEGIGTSYYVSAQWQSETNTQRFYVHVTSGSAQRELGSHARFRDAALAVIAFVQHELAEEEVDGR